MVAVTGFLPPLIGLNELILPCPLAGKPMAGLSFVQLNVLLVPVKIIGFVGTLLKTVSDETGLAAGKSLIMPLTATFVLLTPADVISTSPAMLPNGAPATERT